MKGEYLSPNFYIRNGTERYRDSKKKDIMKLKLLLSILTIASLLSAQECEFLPSSVRPRERESRKHLKNTTVSSGNWCGFVASINLLNPVKYVVTKVAGSWKVPNIVASTGNTSCSLWVGIDGAGSSSVEQLGTEHDWSNGQESHYAWFEMFPNPSHEIVGFPVAVGDTISASVTYIPLVGILPVANTLFILQISNDTQRKYSVIPIVTTMVMDRLCAEWVVEAPWLNQTLPLSDFVTAYFSNCSAEMNGVMGSINNPAWSYEGMNMVANDGSPKAIVSALSVDGKSFSVQWDHI
jgi:hypothetical protein